MKTIFEIIESSFNLRNEVLKISNAFENAKTMGEFSPQFTIKEYIDRFLFRPWNHRGLCFSIDEFLETLTKRINDKQILNDKQNFSEIFDFMYIEFIYNMIELLNMKDESISDLKLVGETILKNIDIILEKTGKEIKEIDYYKYIIIDKDPNIVVASNILQTKSKILPVLEYTHIMTQGDLRLKKSLLIEMGHEFEARKKILAGTEFSRTTSDLSDLLDKLNLRHNTIEGSGKLPKVVTMPEEKMEEWYDKTYKLYLLSVMASDYNSSRTEIKTFLEEIRKK